MEQRQYGTRWAIFPSDTELFFYPYLIDPYNANHIRPKPRIIGPLAAWLDETCPGRWSTEWVRDDSSLARVDKAILVEEENIFHLFKLAWHNHPDIQRPREVDATVVYCPYIPLTITSAQQGQ